ncbi:uroporphyrinogen-III synthase [Aureimonas altamirensis]|uniref:uroporphyrinogen-III synthase n=1 Tax=Aureimonas altamirensis TaxID=370622 RepID=UPI001E5C719F|nr:uroporphyrinogen-III synthase [Aureimonas altamirensis]UHD46588.1 uroporphyrinogen-III synthase [Aureimonas altamirensis]
MRILLLREVTRAADTATELRAHGLTPLLLPLETVEMLSQRLDSAGFGILAITSAHALPWLQRYYPPDGRALFVVGPATAAAAKRFGYDDVTTARGDAASLAELLTRWAAGRRILYAAGLPRRPDLETALARAGLDFATADVYRVVSRQPSPDEVQAALGDRPADCVMLLSAGQAEAYGQLHARFGDAVGTGPIFCLSERIAAAVLPSLRHNCIVSPMPAMDSLIDAMLRYRCTLP